MARFINKDAYNGLPDQYKKLVDDYKMERGYPVQVTVLNRSLTESPKKFLKEGLTEIDINKEMFDQFAKIGGKPVWDEWVGKMNDLGYDGPWHARVDPHQRREAQGCFVPRYGAGEARLRQRLIEIPQPREQSDSGSRGCVSSSLDI